MELKKKLLLETVVPGWLLVWLPELNFYLKKIPHI